MDTILLVIHLLIAAALVVTVLLQRSEGGALGMGGGGSGGPGMFSARGTANLLTRTTAILAAGFMCTSLGLAFLATQGREAESIFDRATPATEESAPAEPAGPSVPTTE